MERRLVGWSRIVKARQPSGVRRLPALWLFADARALSATITAIGRLPVGGAGVILRDGGAASDMARLIRLCASRRLVISVTRDMLGAGGGRVGLHLRRGLRGDGPRPAFITSSAHGAAELRQARKAGAAVIFLSPLLPTRSHAGAPALGVLRWTALARRDADRIAALGGIDGRTVLRLPRSCMRVGGKAAFGA